MRKIVLLVVSVALFFGCATTAREVGVRDKITEKSGYLASKNIDKTFSLLGLITDSDFQMQIKNIENDKKQLLDFHRKEKYSIYELPVGKYIIISISKTETQKQGNVTKIITINAKVPAELNSAIQIYQGKITYIGDIQLDSKVLTPITTTYNYNFDKAKEEIPLQFKKIQIDTIIPIEVK